MHIVDPPHASIPNNRTENTIFDVLLVKSMDAKPGDMEGKLYIYRKNNLHIN